jgi:hypothetical protein
MVSSQPNQYSTPCHVTYIDENNVKTQIGNFSDLQMAYLFVKDVAGEPPWILTPWEEVIEKLYEYHIEDHSGCDVATRGRVAYVIYYDCD